MGKSLSFYLPQHLQSYVLSYGRGLSRGIQDIIERYRILIEGIDPGLSDVEIATVGRVIEQYRIEPNQSRLVPLAMAQWAGEKADTAAMNLAQKLQAMDIVQLIAIIDRAERSKIPEETERGAICTAPRHD